MSFIRSLALPSQLVRNIFRGQVKGCSQLSSLMQKMRYSSTPPDDSKPIEDEDQSGIFKYTQPVDIDVDFDGDDDTDNIIETGVHQRENCDRIILKGLDDDDDEEDYYY